MKKIFLLLFVLAFVCSCSTSEESTSSVTDDRKLEVLSGEDTGEYVLLTFDTNFEKWYEIHNTSTENRDIDYFKKWNIQYVNDWNMRSRSLSGSKFFSMILDFDPFNYNDLNLQRKLFLYFQYVERELKQKILFGSSPSIVI